MIVASVAADRSFLAQVDQRAIYGTANQPTEQAVTDLLPGDLHKMARRW